MTIKDREHEVSIVIPAYNAAGTIMRCVGGLLNQNILDCELVFVNDGSTDNTREIILDLIKKEGAANSIRLIDQENRGLGGARNSGIRAAAAPYITFLDADDILDVNVVKEAVVKAVDENCDIVMFRHIRSGTEINYIRGLHLLRSGGLTGINDYFFRPTSASATARIYNKNFLTSSGILFPENRYHEDLPFVSKAYYLAKKADCVDKIGYDWIVREGSITSSVNNKHIEGIFDSLLDIKRFLYQQNIIEDTLPKFTVYCCKHINNLMYKINFFHEEPMKTELMREIRRRLPELGIMDYHNFIWTDSHIIQFIKNINRLEVC